MYNRKIVFWSACAGMLLFGICIITLGSVVADLRQKFGLNEAAAGALFSLLPVGIVAGSVLFGPVVDQKGYKLLLAVSALVMAVGFFGAAFTLSVLALKFFIFLIGFGGGSINGATNALVADISESEKGANISLLGVFYGVGALGMPLILGLLRGSLNFEFILSCVGVLTILTAALYLIISFPLPKHTEKVPFKQTLKLAGNGSLLLIAFFLFFQSGFEGIINNWTTTYIVDRFSVEQSKALYALTIFVGGFVAMRLLTGSIFRKFTPLKLIIISFSLIAAGLALLKLSGTYNSSLAGLIALGAGLSVGFPVMLGIAGTLFSNTSGTAFSIIFFIALAGNTVINYTMGMIAQQAGVSHLITFAFVVVIFMILLSVIILKKNK